VIRLEFSSDQTNPNGTSSRCCGGMGIFTIDSTIRDDQSEEPVHTGPSIISRRTGSPTTVRIEKSAKGNVNVAVRDVPATEVVADNCRHRRPIVPVYSRSPICLKTPDEDRSDRRSRWRSSLPDCAKKVCWATVAYALRVRSPMKHRTFHMNGPTRYVTAGLCESHRIRGRSATA